MQASNHTNKYLHPSSAVSTEQRISSSLTDLFQFMFNLSLSTSSRAVQRKDFIPAYIILSHGGVKACVSLHISRQAALLIAERVGLCGDQSIVQDVACEIVNIVGNNLRTFYSEQLGVLFTMELPKPGEATLVPKPDVTLNLDFEATPEALVSLDFLCCDAFMSPDPSASASDVRQ